MTFPDQEILKDLNPLEQTLVSVILPFMKIHQEPRGRQKFIQGNMVLVPANVCQTVTQLPRLTTETATIKATLKRRLKYKHHVYCLNIRPQLVIEAAKLLSDSPLYKEHNVDINNDWEDMYNETSLETDTTEEDLVISEQEQLNQNPKKNDIANNDQMKNANYASDDEYDNTCDDIPCDSDEDVCEYIDRFITCHKPEEESEISELVKFQTHKHTHTCKSPRKKKCRFGYPKPPLKTTRILHPLSQADFSKEEILKYKNLWSKISKELDSIENDDEEIETFLQRLQITESEYILAIRASLSAATVFLKRCQRNTMKDEDDDVECSNILTRYSDRPKLMEKVTLAEFAAYYDEPPSRTINRSK
ncbi:unnamed protein product [Mytilus edulis]|uniref:DUF6570 domain-containing protein n=1 Tax=Mytilus edulis TaxID=6550 RepID=A0A8S3UD70_MYTED|nr:unnamed protein product [Mytilus edulis]